MSGIDWAYEKELVQNAMYDHFKISHISIVNDCLIAMRAATASDKMCIRDSIQEGEENPALFPKAHFYSFHCTAACFSANYTGEEKQGTANNMSDDNGKKTFSKAK